MIRCIPCKTEYEGNSNERVKSFQNATGNEPRTMQLANWLTAAEPSGTYALRSVLQPPVPAAAAPSLRPQ